MKMTEPNDYSFNRYLAAKKSVDDRALNRRVLQVLQSLFLPQLCVPIHVLEVGAGIGTMIERLLDWRVLDRAVYTAVDADVKAVSEACRRLPQWADHCGYGFTVESSHTMSLRRADQEVLVTFEAARISDFVARERGRRTWDLMLANAFFDLVDLPSTLPYLLALLRPNGFLYFTINFDGLTIFQPEIDPDLDAQIATLYHESMDRRMVSEKPAGDSRTGRHLLTQLRAHGADLLDAGGSDWIVFAGPDGYPDDEAYFLHHIIHMISTALRGHPALDAKRFDAWIAERHNQVEKGTLIYMTHQMDVLGRVPGNTA
jgi:hypothetical protein